MSGIKKRIDWSNLGGFPLCQDDLQWITDGLEDALTAMIETIGAGNTPVVLTGMGVSGGGNTVDDGFFYYKGEIIKFTGSTVVPGGGEVALVLIVPSATALTFNDTSTPNVVLNKTAGLTHAITVTDATHFPVSALITYAEALAAQYREAWQALPVSTLVGDGHVTGNIYYTRDLLTNTVTIRGALTANNPQNFSASPAITGYLTATLPVGYRPADDVFFICNASVSSLLSTRMKDDAGFEYIDIIQGAISGAGGLHGAIAFAWLKPEVAVTFYGIRFSCTFTGY